MRDRTLRLALAMPWLLFPFVATGSMLLAPAAWFGTHIDGGAIALPMLVPLAIAVGMMAIKRGPWLAAFAIVSWFAASFLVLVAGLAAGMARVPLGGLVMATAAACWLGSLGALLVALDKRDGHQKA